MAFSKNLFKRPSQVTSRAKSSADPESREPLIPREKRMSGNEGRSAMATSGKATSVEAANMYLMAMAR
jgi:hypothetical protein